MENVAEERLKQPSTSCHSWLDWYNYKNNIRILVTRVSRVPLLYIDIYMSLFVAETIFVNLIFSFGRIINLYFFNELFTVTKNNMDGLQWIK